MVKKTPKSCKRSLWTTPKAGTFFFNCCPWIFGTWLEICRFITICYAAAQCVQRKLKLKLCMHDNNRTATFEKELNHNQESYLLFHRCASTKTSLPRLLQIEIWPPLFPKWGLCHFEIALNRISRCMWHHKTSSKIASYESKTIRLNFFWYHQIKKNLGTANVTKEFCLILRRYLGDSISIRCETWNHFFLWRLSK